MFGLHAAFTVEDGSLERAVEEAGKLGVGFHSHVAEAASDEEASIEKYGLRVLERLQQKGALGPKSLAIHCVHINEEEMDILKETGTVAVHNPQSNMNNAVGVAPVLQMLEKGILVGLGTDGMTSNMCDEVRVANILHKLNQKDPRVAFVESCQLLLQNNPGIVARQFEQEFGVLRPGALGDVILMDYIPPTPLNENSFLGHFLFGICGSPVDTTIVGGKVLMREGEASVLYKQAVIIKPGEISWGYAGEKKDFLETIIASLEDYLPSGVDYLSVYMIVENVSRTGSTFSELIPLLEEKVKSRPFEPRYLHLLGMAYQEVGKIDRAEKCYARALQIDSDFATAHLSLGKLYARQGRSVSARTHLEAFLTLFPESSLTSAVGVLLKEVGEAEKKRTNEP